ncbi:MAG: histidine kinase [Balneolaceae bacterium]|nr:histidine kinase [Balneolaceae bacterium]MBO6547833.1 histidine kinase [Balneolaceae bacterium]MBO6648344.1 histidine kinase [Balneolaceae bacterium]
MRTNNTCIRTLLFHILFWVVYTLIFTFVEGGYQNQFREAFLIEVAHTPVRFAVIYFNYFFLLPKYLEKARYIEYLGFTLLTLFVGSLAQRYLMGAYFNPIIFPDWHNTGTFAFFRVLQAGIIIASPLIFIIGFTVISRWVSLSKQTADLEKEKKQAELQLLKNQLNPHFFFNTLNNLFGLAQEKSDLTERVILKLSDLMSYVLYETDQTFVSLNREIAYIKNYIELEKIRYGDRFTCNFSLSGNVTNKKIPPMLFLPFVENAFKHGINQESKDTWINIQVNISDEKITFELENSLPKVPSIRTEESNLKGGIGIRNVRRRLELLYLENFVLDTYLNQKSYRALVEIPVINQNMI